MFVMHPPAARAPPQTLPRMDKDTSATAAKSFVVLGKPRKCIRLGFRPGRVQVPINWFEALLVNHSALILVAQHPGFPLLDPRNSTNGRTVCRGHSRLHDILKRKWFLRRWERGEGLCTLRRNTLQHGCGRLFCRRHIVQVETANALGWSLGRPRRAWC